jgi:hydroxymethylpyrimidine pyrophosphatase-like HAD family hydrolase
MKLHVLALDYDGTIATDGALDPHVRTAIEAARRRGFVVVLATGRILDDLRCLLGDLSLFDAIVAENGAVVVFPAAGRSTQLCAPVSPEFVAALRARRVAMRTGVCVVELAATERGVALQILHDLELPLTLHFNRDRLMVLPQAVNKATGLREALRTMRLSTHNAIAIGDAENDHELLAACEIGAAVAWGSPALRRTADRVVPGDGPAAVARYLDTLTTSQQVPAEVPARRHLVLGRDRAGEVLSLAVRGRNVLIAGDPRSGKSWVGGLLCEQLIVQQYCTCIIDPEGDYTELESLPGVIVLGSDRPPSVHEVARTLRHSDLSLVLDLTQLDTAEKHDYVLRMLRLLRDVRGQTGLPHRIVVDEAHHFLHDPSEARVIDHAAGGHTLITYRVCDLEPELLRSAECVVVTRETDAAQARLLHDVFKGSGEPAQWQAELAELAFDEAALLPVSEEAGGRLRRFRVAPRLTRHVRHRHKYLDVPAGRERAFHFRFDGVAGPSVASLGELTRVLVCTPAERLRQHVIRGDLSRWIGDVLCDGTLATTVREIEEQHRLGRAPDFNTAVIHAIRERYGVPEGLI